MENILTLQQKSYIAPSAPLKDHTQLNLKKANNGKYSLFYKNSSNCFIGAPQLSRSADFQLK